MSTKINRKQEILEAALACFNEHGVEGTTIDLIRERSGTSVGSLYHHFGNKEAIAVALHETALQHHQAHVAALLKPGAGAAATVRALVTGYIDSVSENPALSRFLMQSRGFMVRTADAAMTESIERDLLASGFRSWLEPLLAQGAIRPFPMECYLPLILGPAQEYAWSWLAGRSARHIKEFRDLFADAAWNAVRPDQAG